MVEVEPQVGSHDEYHGFIHFKLLLSHPDDSSRIFDELRILAAHASRNYITHNNMKNPRYCGAAYKSWCDAQKRYENADLEELQQLIRQRSAYSRWNGTRLTSVIKVHLHTCETRCTVSANISKLKSSRILTRFNPWMKILPPHSVPGHLSAASSPSMRS